MNQARPQVSSLIDNAIVEMQKKIERRNKAIEQFYNRDGPVHQGLHLYSNLRVNNQASEPN